MRLIQTLRLTRHFLRDLAALWAGPVKPRLPAPLPNRLNLGCGYDKRAGYLNVDTDPACKPDLLLSPDDDSAIARAHFVEVFARDVLEHIPRHKSLAALLAWNSYLKPGGRLILQTSNILGVASQLQKEDSFSNHFGWTICLFGNQAHSGDFHFTGFTETSLRVHLQAAGFRIDKIGDRDGWMFHVEATKTEDWLDLAPPLDLPHDAFVDAAYRKLLERDPDSSGRPYIAGLARQGKQGRLAAVMHLASSVERLHLIARRLGA